MDQRVPMTPRGFAALKEELQRLKSEDRPANIKDIEEAIAHGDLSENAEYHAAKEKQAHIAGRIAMLDDRIARAQIIETEGQTPDKVRFGATVRLSDIETDEEVSYTIVGEDEADLKQGRISVTSPVAQALMSKEVGDEVHVKVPKGTREFGVLAIEFEDLS
jgi:transcription elongation factor GreA